MVKNCTLRTRCDRDDLRTDSQRTQFLASQNGIWACFNKTDREKGGYWLVVFEFKLSG